MSILFPKLILYYYCLTPDDPGLRNSRSEESSRSGIFFIPEIGRKHRLRNRNNEEDSMTWMHILIFILWAMVGESMVTLFLCIFSIVKKRVGVYGKIRSLISVRESFPPKA
jgi:hypothetical protein